MTENRRSASSALDRTARHRQDVEFGNRSPAHRLAVRPHLARRRPRRSRNSRPSAHLHRRAARASGAGLARRRDDESGDHARRSGQDRRRLARRPIVGAASSVLDPAQNYSFRDHYLDVDSTCRRCSSSRRPTVAETIPPALFDRMEVIRFDEPQTEEKVAIARRHLWPRRGASATGCRRDEVSVEPSVLRAVVTDYTREAGVRQLERELGTACGGRPRESSSETSHHTDCGRRPPCAKRWGVRRCFTKQPFARQCRVLATGLAVTGVGGDVLFVEAASMPGQNGLVLTGQLRRRHARVGADRPQLRAQPCGGPGDIRECVRGT